MRKSKDIEHVFDQAGLRHPCDLDLLRFFQRHPRALLTSEQLAACVGYDAQQVGTSLARLIGAGLVTRSQTLNSARKYVLTSGATNGAWLTSLLEVAATQDGRRALLQALDARARRSPGGPPEAGGKLRAVRAGRSGRARKKATHD
jgi:DNA-binding MarR family transcriptional regulator